MSKLRIAIVGCGGICRGVHVPSYLRDPRVEIVALCDIVPEKARALAADNGLAADVVQNWRDLLPRPDIDAIDICTPNYLHSEIAVAALDAGKHVFCEKPDAIDPDKAQAMKDAAERNGRVLMVMRNNRFADGSAYARRLVDAGRIGDIYAGRCGWQRRRGIPGKGGWFTTKAQSGGGPLIDLGVHMIDLAIWLMGSPRPVSVSGATFCKFADDDKSDSVNSAFGEAKADGVFDVEDFAMGLIRFDNGAVLQIEFSWASNVKRETRYVELRGTKAGITWRDGDFVEIHGEDEGELVDIRPSGQLRDDGHARNLRNFVDVLLEGAEPCYKPREGVDMIRILAAMYESARTGAEVRI